MSIQKILLVDDSKTELHHLSELLGRGASYRVLRFRLSDTGPVSNGVGQESGVPVFLRVTRNFTEQMALHFYCGVVAGGKLRVENSSGDKLRTEDFDPAPLFGLTFVGRF